MKPFRHILKPTFVVAAKVDFLSHPYLIYWKYLGFSGPMWPIHSGQGRTFEIPLSESFVNNVKVNLTCQDFCVR